MYNAEAEQSALPVIRNVVLDANELDPWLDQRDQFGEPEELRRAKIIGRLRLLYHGWASQESGLGKTALPFSIASWKKMMKSLKLPSSYALNLADRKHVPPQVVIQDASTRSPMGRLFRGSDSQALMLKQVAFVKVLLFSTLP